MKEKNNKTSEKKKQKREWHPLAKIFILILSMLFVIALLYLTINFMLPNTEKNLTLQTKTDRSESSFVDDDAVMGDKKAPILIVEFGEFMCPFCGEVHHEIEPLWNKEYIETGKAKFIFRDFINSNHPQAYPAAMANECAHAQGKQWPMYDLLFDNAYSKDTWIQYNDEKSLLDVFEKYAKEIGLNIAQYKNCMSNGIYAQEIKGDIFAGLTIWVSGTPTIYIGNDKTGFTKIRGAQPYSVYKQIIDEKLKSE